MIEGVHKQRREAEGLQAVHQIAAGAGQAHQRGGQNHGNDLKAHQPSVIEPRQVDRKPPFDSRQGPCNARVRRRLGRQQRIGSDQEEEQPFQAPDRIRYLPWLDAADQQGDDLYHHQCRHDKPPCSLRPGESRHRESDCCDCQQEQHLKDGYSISAAFMSNFSHADQLQHCAETNAPAQHRTFDSEISES